MARIELTDNFINAVVKLVDGNPGATRACMELFQKTPAIDPDNGLGGMAPLFMFDTWEIYGPKIWILYSDVCNGDCTKVLALIRAVQIGLMDMNTLTHAIETYGEGIDHALVLELVQSRLPAFGKAE